MRIGFSINDLKQREVDLALQFSDGLKRHGHDFDTLSYDQDIDDYDLVCIIGVKSLWRMKQCEDAGIPYLYFDKGYSRKAGCYRIAINGHQPTDYFPLWDYPDDRRRLFNWNPEPWKDRKHGNDVLFAGSSGKFHEFKSLPDPTTYAKSMIDEIRRYKTCRIIYRPKPSWKGAEPIKGTVYSREKAIDGVFDTAGVLVTYGSNACFEALLKGIPAVILGDAVTQSISSTDLARVNNPYRAPDEEREQLLNNLAYCQFTPDEMKSGDAWDILNMQLNKELSSVYEN